MKKLNIPRAVHISSTNRDRITIDGEYVEELLSPTHHIIISGEDYEQAVDSGKLMLDAIKTYHEHEQLPSQLGDQVDKLQQEKQELYDYVRSITIIVRSFRDYDPKTIGYKAYEEHKKLLEKYK